MAWRVRTRACSTTAASTSLALGVANGTKAYVTALDPARGELTIRTDDGDRSVEVTLPRLYLQARLEDERRTLDHAYATTVHKTQGGTYDQGFQRVGASTSKEQAYVGSTRVRERLDLFMVGEARRLQIAETIDLPPGPERLPGDPVYQPARVVGQAITSSQAHTLALDARQLGEPVRELPTRALRAEAERLEAQLGRERLRPRAVQLRRVDAELGDATRTFAATRQQREQAEQAADRARWGRQRREATAALERARAAERAAADRAARLTEQQRQAAQHERRRAVWADRHQPELQRQAALRAELAWRHRATARSAEVTQPQWLRDFLGLRPGSVRGARRWRQLAAGVADYRERYGVADSVRALGPEPKSAELGQRRAWRELRQQAGRLWQQQRDRGDQHPNAQSVRGTRQRPRLHERADVAERA
ncbi:MAG TPA: hypothetical protein VKG45_08490 [Actinomycetes bacterium]|nr:hypothetical protein [Actinomycetes bacterium]